MLSIVIVTFNSIKFIKSCLDSVLSQGPLSLEVIVVDNCSQDGTADFVRNNYPGVALMENEKNLGACKARNQGIAASRGSWVLTLDCDVVLAEDFFLKILPVIANLPPRIGILQPKILNADRKTIHSCGIYLSPFRRFYNIGEGKIAQGRCDQSSYIFAASSACAFYSRVMLEDIKEDAGYFDERFFFLVEDVDLAWRAQRKGWKAFFSAEALCFHQGNSSGLDRRFRQYLCFRNRYFSIIKNEGLGKYAQKIFPLLFYDLPRLLYLSATNYHIWRRCRLERTGSWL